MLILFGWVKTLANDQNLKYNIEQSEMEFEQNLRYPEVKSKYHNSIVEHQSKVGKSLRNLGIQVETIRKGEILVITIPAQQLFEANKTELSKLAVKKLEPVFSLLKTPGFYKFLIAMHSDNTGNSLYSENLTADRAVAITDWAVSNGYPSSDIIPYSMGETSPIVPNNSMSNRATNRRLELYIVPNTLMINSAKTNKLK